MSKWTQKLFSFCFYSSCISYNFFILGTSTSVFLPKAADAIPKLPMEYDRPVDDAYEEYDDEVAVLDDRLYVPPVPIIPIL